MPNASHKLFIELASKWWAETIVSTQDERHAAGLAHRPAHDFSEAVQVDVAGNDVGVGIGDGDERLIHVGVAEADSSQQAAMGRPLEHLLDE
jgi:hypothetical protein